MIRYNNYHNQVDPVLPRAPNLMHQGQGRSHTIIEHSRDFWKTSSSLHTPQHRCPPERVTLLPLPMVPSHLAHHSPVWADANQHSKHSLSFLSPLRITTERRNRQAINIFPPRKWESSWWPGSHNIIIANMGFLPFFSSTQNPDQLRQQVGFTVSLAPWLAAQPAGTIQWD